MQTGRKEGNRGDRFNGVDGFKGFDGGDAQIIDANLLSGAPGPRCDRECERAVGEEP